MSKLNAAKKGFAMRSIRALPLPAVREIERAADLEQGKGLWTETVLEEAPVAIRLLPHELRDEPVVLDGVANVGMWTVHAISGVQSSEQVEQGRLGQGHRV